MRDAFAHDGPALVDVATDPNELSLPPKVERAVGDGVQEALQRALGVPPKVRISAPGVSMDLKPLIGLGGVLIAADTSEVDGQVATSALIDGRDRRRSGELNAKGRLWMGGGMGTPVHAVLVESSA